MALNLVVLLVTLCFVSHAASMPQLDKEESMYNSIPEQESRGLASAAGSGPREEGPWVGIGKRSYKPYPSVGALSDMQSFFENLRNNLDYLETLPEEERDILLGKAPPAPEQEVNQRASNSAAYLNALRSQRPSYKIRNFVDSSEPRGPHRYDPSLLWTGLGKRR